jgi:Methyltransferase domain
MTVEVIRVSSEWLKAREAADAAARSRKLVDELRRYEPPVGHWLIHDLGSGSGSMGRWLAPLLPGPQRWILHDRDPDLLAHAAADARRLAADGAEVTVETVVSDVTQLDAEDLVGATLVVASALLDLLTREELERLIPACAGAGCPVLFALSVTGHVQLLPPDPLDARIALAFNAHQGRVTLRGDLLGPDAVDAAVGGFRRLGAEVIVQPTPWRLGGSESELLVEWFCGWVDAACEQEPTLMPEVESYRRRRLREAAAGALAVTVGHVDLLVLP